jgi:uncharacterized protein (DUF1684 family)
LKLRHAIARGALACVLLHIACSRSTPASRDYATKLQQDRAGKDALFRTDEGPLTPQQRAMFRGLNYWKPDLEFAVDAHLTAAAAPESLQFPTSKGTFDPYVKLGRLQFELRGRPYALTLYRSVEGGHLFLPFIDRTSGKDSYGAGRYIDIELGADGNTRLDFNRAYNPYCAYNPGWTCPLAPSENMLDLRVEAGERSFAPGH